MPKVIPEYKEKARQKIIHHATNLFSKKGYTKTKMVDIAESVGVSKGAIYQYFKSKSEILLAILKSYIQLREQEVSNQLDSKGWKFITTGTFFDHMYSLHRDSLFSNPAIFLELADNEAILSWIKIGSEKWLQGLKTLIDRQVDAGEISIKISSESLARGMLALRDGLYNSISLGSNMEKCRDTWIEIIGALIKPVPA